MRPSIEHFFEAKAVYNPCVTLENGKFKMLYRAVSGPIQVTPGIGGPCCEISSIGYAESEDGIHFKNRRFFFGPEYSWEEFGCEDPRFVKIKGKYYIFYTAVAFWPPIPRGVKAALAISEDFKEYEKKGVVIPVNSKAATLFPEKIQDKYALIFTLYPDIPPSKVVIAFFNKIEEIWNPPEGYWKEFLKYPELEENILMEAIPPKRFVEVGAPPILTDEGWLLIYPEISPELSFSIHAMLLDLENPFKIIARTKKPLLEPELIYEVKGRSAGPCVFPEGAVVKDNTLFVYYGAADKYVCVATCDFDKLLNYLLKECKV